MPRLPHSMFCACLACATLCFSPQFVRSQPVAPQTAVKVETATQKVVVDGVVRGLDNQPIPNAEIMVETSRRGRAKSGLVRSDAQGHFHLEVLAPQDQMEALEADFSADEAGARGIPVLAYAPGFAPVRALLSRELPNLALTPGTEASGFVRDASGKPVEGVIVRARSIETHEDAEDRVFMSYISLDNLPTESALTKAFQTRSDAQGRWTLHDLPPGGTLTMTLEDPRFVSPYLRVPIGVATAEQTVLIAKPGARAVGKIVYPDGAPVAGVSLTVRVKKDDKNTYADALSKEDGTFSILGLEPGEATLSVGAPSPEWAPSGINGVQLAVGTETRIPNFKMTPGTKLTGRVLETDTRAPIAGAKVYSDGPFGGAVSTLSDAQGRYTLSVATGSNRFYVVSRPQDYNSDRLAEVTLDIKADSRNAPDLTLKRGLTLTGTALDDSGKPATGAIISSGPVFAGKSTTVDAQGHWTLRGVDQQSGERNNGKLRLQTSGDWALVGDGLVDVTPNPLHMQLRHIQRTDLIIKVVDAEGKPVSGANVTAKIALGGGSYRFSRFVTNQAGEFVMAKVRPDTQAELTAARPGYVLVQSGAITSVGPLDGKGTLRARNVVLSTLNAKVSGRVLNAAGQPVAGVLVAALGYDTFNVAGKAKAGERGTVTTDAEGRFALEGLKGGDVVVGAAKERDFGLGKTTTAGAQPLELRLVQGEVPPAADEDAGFALLAAQMKAEGGQEYIWRSGLQKLALRNPERALKFVDTLGAGNAESLAVGILLELAKQDPVRALQLGRERMANLQNARTKSYGEQSFALLTAEADPQNARKVYDAYATTTEVANLDPNKAYEVAYLAALAGRLKNPDAEGWVQALTLTIKATPHDDAMFRIGSYAQMVASGDLATAKTFINGLSPAMQVRALEDVIPEVGAKDPAEALKLLAQMEALVARPDLPVEEPRNDAMYRPQPAESLSRTREELAQLLLKTDPKKAFELASKMAGNTGYRKAPLMAQAAVKLPREEAKAALRQAFETARQNDYSWTGATSQIAAFAASVDPQLGEEFFETARAKFSQGAPEPDEYNSTGLERVNYAFYRAPLAPEESRLLLENEWQYTNALLKNVGTVPQQEDWKTERHISMLSRIATAMSTISMARSEAMFTELAALAVKNPQGRSDILRARANVFNWLIASEDERRAMMLY